MKYSPGILAKQLVIRPFIPWHIRLLIMVSAILLLLALSWGMYDAGSKSSNNKEIIDVELNPLKDLGICLERGNKELCALLAKLARQLQVKNTSEKDLANLAKTLAEENNRLKEELSYFHHLMSGNEEATAGVSIYRFDLKKEEAAGQYRYMLLLVQNEKRPQEFEGDLKFFVTLRQNDKKKLARLSNKDSSNKLSVNFKFYQRIEDTFQVSQNVEVESIQVQVFLKGENDAKLTQTAKLSM